MQLTTHETKLVERLRKEQRQWPRLRWFLLAAGIFAALCSSFVVIELLKHIDIMVAGHDDVVSRLWLFGFALVWPKCLILFSFAALFIFWAIRDWHGNANRVLLLKLLEAQQKDESQ
jgi:hypothetical protein